METIVIILMVLAIGAMAFIRFAPSDPSDWHVDPLTAVAPRWPTYWLIRDGAATPAVLLPDSPDQVMARLDAIARATPRTEPLAGEGFHKTWITRSRRIGFPDCTSVRLEPVPRADGGQGTRLSLFARSRFGNDDFGVNRARAENWLAQLQN